MPLAAGDLGLTSADTELVGREAELARLELPLQLREAGSLESFDDQIASGAALAADGQGMPTNLRMAEDGFTHANLSWGNFINKHLIRLNNCISPLLDKIIPHSSPTHFLI